MSSTAGECPVLPGDSGTPASSNLAELSSLPPEILALIFHFLVLSHQTYMPALYSDNRRQCDPPMLWIPSVLHTCSLWRAISISSPQLWSFLWVGSSEILTLQMLEWSGSEPLYVYCPELPHAKVAKFCGSIEGPCGRQAIALGRVIQGTRVILSMHLWGPTHSTSPLLFPRLPGLEELYLATTLPHWHSPTAVSLEDLLKRHEELRVLTVGSFRPYGPQMISARVLPATLTRLVLWNLDQWTNNSNWAWLQNLPELELLMLEGGRFPPEILPDSTFHLPMLRKLHLGHMDITVLHNLLHLLNIPKCTRFNLHTRHSSHSPSTDDLHGLAQELKRLADQLTMLGGTEFHAHTSLSDYLVKITVCRKFDEEEISIFSINFRLGDMERPAKDHYLPLLWKSMSSFSLELTGSMTDIFAVAPNSDSSGSSQEEETED
ncbi:hypothetical protein DL96DRAFT_1014550 [Flagelloscypha sp. PMI_526]|nr:hypothetical protein DL96DRAFT_1014550 [Flagelloscypha sp. PMI_526]